MATTKKQFTTERDHLPYTYHYLFGCKNTCMDVDCIEYHLDDDYKTVYDTIIDYKSGLYSTCFLNPLDPYQQEKINKYHSTIRKYQDLANNKFKNPIPFFVVYTYLEDYFDGYRMMYVIPGNQLAVDFFARITKDDFDVDGGMWMTVKMYCNMLLKLKNIKLLPTDMDDYNKLDDNYKIHTQADIFKIKLKIAEDKAKKDQIKKLFEDWIKENHPDLS